MTNLSLIAQREILGKKFKIYGDFENPLFLAKDVAEWIGYDKSSINKMLETIDDDEKILMVSEKSSEGIQANTKYWFLTEDGLYEVLMQSRKPIAKAFKKEVKKILKEVRKTGKYEVPTTVTGFLELSVQAIKELEVKVDNVRKEVKEEVKQDLEDFKQDLPLLAVEIEHITKARNRTAVTLLGGKESKAYKNKSLRGKVYSDLSREVKRQFGVDTYKAIKRSDCDKVIKIIENYKLPMCLYEEINKANGKALQLAI